MDMWTEDMLEQKIIKLWTSILYCTLWIPIIISPLNHHFKIWKTHQSVFLNSSLSLKCIFLFETKINPSHFQLKTSSMNFQFLDNSKRVTHHKHFWQLSVNHWHWLSYKTLSEIFLVHFHETFDEATSKCLSENYTETLGFSSSVVGVYFLYYSQTQLFYSYHSAHQKTV